MVWTGDNVKSKLTILFFLLLPGVCRAGGHQPEAGKYILTLKDKFTSYPLTDKDLKWKEDIENSKLGQKEVVGKGGRIRVFVLTDCECLYVQNTIKDSFPVYVNSEDPNELLVLSCDGSKYDGNKDDVEQYEYFYIDLKKRKICYLLDALTFRHSAERTVLCITSRGDPEWLYEIGKVCPECEVSFGEHRITWRGFVWMM
jgi:hypothetical protein